MNATPTTQLADAARFDPQELDLIANSAALGPERAMPLMLIAEEPPLVRVTIWIGLVEPTEVAGKMTLAGATVAVTAAAVPVPESATVWGLFPAVSVNVSVAARLPETEGVNATATMQLADVARLNPQALALITKSEELVPDTAMLAMLIADGPPLVSVTVWTVLVEPTDVAGNIRLEGVIVAVATGVVPSPESATVWGLFPAVSVNVRAAARLPEAEGVNVTVIAQFAEAAIVDPHALLVRAKSEEAAPVTFALLRETD